MAGQRTCKIAAGVHFAGHPPRVRDLEKSHEHDIARLDRGAIHEGDDLVRGAAVIVDLPMRSVDVGEGCTRPVADELERIARGGAKATEVENQITIGLADTEREYVVTGVALEDVGARATVECVVA